MRTKQIGTLTEISSDKYIHKLNTDLYFKKGILLPDDTLDMYEEVEDIPKYTIELYKKKVRELIKERYDIEDEIALYRLMNTKSLEFDEYYAYCEECKKKAKEILNNGEEG